MGTQEVRCQPSPNIKIQIPICCPYVSRKSSSEKFLKYELIVSCVIISLILIINLCYKAWISQGEF